MKILQISNRGMKKIILGNVSHVEAKINGIKTILPYTERKNFKTLKELGYENIIKRSHGAIIFELPDNKVGFSCQTSHEKFNLAGQDITNIKIKEALNPIEWTNPLFILPKVDFIDKFKVEMDLEKLMTKERYRDNADIAPDPKDLFYCMFRVAWKITASDSPVFYMKFHPQDEIVDKLQIAEKTTEKVMQTVIKEFIEVLNLEITKSETFITAENHDNALFETLTPSQVELSKAPYDEVTDLADAVNLFIKNIDENDSSLKEKLYEDYKVIREELISNLLNK